MIIPRIALCVLLFPAVLCAQTVLVKPYLQPGDGPSLVGADVKVLTWVTDQLPAEFAVEFRVFGQPARTAKPERLALDFMPAKVPAVTPRPATPAPAVEIPVTIEDVTKTTIKEASPQIAEKEQHFYRYRATLDGLAFNSEVAYRVTTGKAVVREGKFRTRATPDKPIRFVAMGDLANGKPEQNAIAYQVSLVKPDFVVALGDIVYSAGRVSQYLHHFWATYNDVSVPSAKTGAPLMASIPFYPVIGNHDADVAKLPDYPDAFGAFYFFSAPLNGPGVGPWNTPLGKDAKVAADFKTNVGAMYPALNVYSFDYGAAHFTVLDTNSYNSPSFMKLAPWIENDLKQSQQRWKFVCIHAPPFQTSPQHFTEQKMRLLEPIFEANGVDVVFAGHVHNYQRSKPLRFTPNPPTRDPKGRVNGDYVMDETFDGVTDTTPEGVLHIVSGGGGATLYNAKEFQKTIEQLKKDHPGNYVPFTAKYFAEKNSFSVVELTPDEFVLKQITIEGKEVDRIRITKPRAVK